MTTYRVVAEDDDESLTVLETIHFNNLSSAIWYFAHERYGQPGAVVLLQMLTKDEDWKTVDWREQEEN